MVDRVTFKPIVGATVTSSGNTTTTDSTGTAQIEVTGANGIGVKASGYLSQVIIPTSQTVTVQLIPIWIVAAGGAGVAGIIIVLSALAAKGGKAK